MDYENLEKIKNQFEKKAKTHKRACVCMGAACQSSGAYNALEKLKSDPNGTFKDKLTPVQVGCMGACHLGPLMQIDDSIYQNISKDNVADIAEDHLSGGKLFEHALLFSEKGKKGETNSYNTAFYNKQKKIVLENCGAINPEVIDEYIGAGGYQALHSVLTTMLPEDVIGEIKQSGLRGRGGGGFPTGIKLETVYRFVSDTKYVVCNGDEGDPGAFMDRSIMEGDPHRVLEGMIISGFAVGAQQGYLYVRAEYPLAIKRFELAIKQAERNGLLGNNIMGSDFSFHVEIRVGAGAFVCGEETALIASIEGGRGTPRPRPPYPAESGIWGKPTLINNVETFANIAPIISKGADWYRGFGTTKSPGTKVFALAGKVKNTGLIEVPMGMTLREIIFEIGGGMSGDKKFKAAQTGGPSGGCIPEQFLDTPVEYESLMQLGSIMGSGGLIVMDESSCMIDVARYFMEFCMDESCGKCVPCRVGTKQMYEMLNKICHGQGTPILLDTLKGLIPYVKETSLCGLGMTAPNPLNSTLKYFYDEYEAHIKDKRCPAGVCPMDSAPVPVFSGAL